jgi:hypothetical protein
MEVSPKFHVLAAHPQGNSTQYPLDTMLDQKYFQLTSQVNIIVVNCCGVITKFELCMLHTVVDSY